MSLFANFGNLKVKRFLEADTRLTIMKRLGPTTTLLQNVYMHAFRLLDLFLYSKIATVSTIWNCGKPFAVRERGRREGQFTGVWRRRRWRQVFLHGRWESVSRNVCGKGPGICRQSRPPQATTVAFLILRYPRRHAVCSLPGRHRINFPWSLFATCSSSDSSVAFWSLYVIKSGNILMLCELTSSCNTCP